MDKHDIVLLPKGFYRLSKTLVITGGALVGVGRTLSVLMAATSGFAGDSLLRVTGSRVILHQLEYATFWHIPNLWLLDWRASDGFWRQAHGIRTCDVLAFPSPNVGPSCDRFLRRDLAANLSHPLSIISGGGRFYTFYVEDWQYQDAGYRHLLINASTVGLSIYHINPDCATGDAAVEVVSSTSVQIFGMKSEGNFCQLWVRQSTDVLYTGFGGFASPFGVNDSYPVGFAQYTPSMIRVEDSSVTLANLWGACRIGEISPSGFGGIGISPNDWSFVTWRQASSVKHVLAPLVRPIVFKLSAANN